jgi:hypothetical protein
VIQLTTDIPVDPGTVSSATMTFVDVTANNAVVAGIWTTSTDRNVLSFAPGANLAAAHSFQLTCYAEFAVNGNNLFSTVVDINGNNLNYCSSYVYNRTRCSGNDAGSGDLKSAERVHRRANQNPCAGIVQ